jgi:type IV pilus assembly protein PilW
MIELMVGAAIALFVAAAGSTLLVGQLRDSRALMLDTRLTQELRNTSELIARDLRRAGYSGHAGTAANPYAYTASAATTDSLSLRYSMDASENDRVDVNEEFGFRRRNGAIEMQLGGNWQSVTDANVVTVTDFSVTPLIAETAVVSPCPARLQSRRVVIAITAALTSDPRVTRSVRTTTHLRTDTLIESCPT